MKLVSEKDFSLSKVINGKWETYVFKKGKPVELPNEYAEKLITTHNFLSQVAGEPEADEPEASNPEAGKPEAGKPENLESLDLNTLKNIAIEIGVEFYKTINKKNLIRKINEYIQEVNDEPF